MPENTTTRSSRATVEPKLIYRADIDQSGDWYVWRRLGTSGWAAMQRCQDRMEALQVAADLNRAEESGS